MPRLLLKHLKKPFLLVPDRGVSFQSLHDAHSQIVDIVLPIVLAFLMLLASVLGVGLKVFEMVGFELGYMEQVYLGVLVLEVLYFVVELEPVFEEFLRNDGFLALQKLCVQNVFSLHYF